MVMVPAAEVFIVVLILFQNLNFLLLLHLFVIALKFADNFKMAAALYKKYIVWMVKIEIKIFSAILTSLFNCFLIVLLGLDQYVCDEGPFITDVTL